VSAKAELTQILPRVRPICFSGNPCIERLDPVRHIADCAQELVLIDKFESRECHWRFYSRSQKRAGRRGKIDSTNFRETRRFPPTPRARHLPPLAGVDARERLAGGRRRDCQIIAFQRVWIGVNQRIKKGGAADEPTFKNPPAALWRPQLCPSGGVVLMSLGFGLRALERG
jgi:hypothetical protein